jgi:ParB/RepB/Spo0J family partition protein
MSLTALNQSSQLDIALPQIGEHYGSLRLVWPAAENRMLRSIERYGQLAPVVVNQGPDESYEMVDGFKRLRALKKLGAKSLRARVVKLGVQVGKAALLQLNWTGKTVTELEEGLVVQALCRDDGLQQKDVAALLERHESWVSRRMALVERLSEEVQESIRLGLVCASSGRELTKLPRGNQEAALKAIRKHHLTFRETATLVAELLTTPSWNHVEILRCMAIPEQRTPPRPTKDASLQEAATVERRLVSMVRACLAVTEKTTPELNARLNNNARQGLAPMIAQAIGSAETAVANLKKFSSAGEVSF